MDKVRGFSGPYLFAVEWPFAAAQADETRLIHFRTGSSSRPVNLFPKPDVVTSRSDWVAVLRPIGQCPVHWPLP